MSETLTKELAAVLNRHSMEDGSNTPDFILATFLLDCLASWDKTVAARERWYGRGPESIEPKVGAPVVSP